MNKLLTTAAALICLMMVYLTSCEDDTLGIGGSLLPGNVSIQVDSSFTVSGESVYCPQIDAKSTTQLIGHINVPEYGDLNCSFVSQMLSSVMLNVPDSIRPQDVDSLKLRMRFANGNLTGDSLAPQQLKVYALNKQLPRDINNTFDPTGYYDPATPLGIRPYTGSALGMNDAVYANKGMFRSIYVNMPQGMGQEIFRQYRTNPATFQTPEAFNQYFPGIYVEHSFGRGMVVNITSTDMVAYYHTITKQYVSENGVTVAKDSVLRDSVVLYNVSPEIISSNRLKLNVAQPLLQRIQRGDAVMISPAGYNVRLHFPARDIVNRYNLTDFNLAVVNTLTLSIPVEEIANDFGITPPPYLLMVPTAKMQEFFLNNEIPNNLTSFYAVYNSTTHSYEFTALREYILSMIRKDVIDDADEDFTLVPVSITTEKGDLYGSEMVVSTCVPYMNRPSMCVLKLQDAKVKFTYSLKEK